MPRASNPFYQPRASGMDSINQGIGAVMTALMNQPTASEKALKQAQSDYYVAQAQNARIKNQEAAGQQALGTRIAALAQPRETPRPDAEFQGPMAPMPFGDKLRADLPSIMGDAVSYGVKPDTITSTLMAYAPYMGGTDQDIANAYVANGKPIGVNDAFTLTGRDAVAQRNAAAEQSKALAVVAATPRTEAQVKGGLLQNNFGNLGALTPEQQAVLSAIPTLEERKGTAFGQLPADKQAVAVGPSKEQTIGDLVGSHFDNLDTLTPSQRQILGANPSSSSTPRNYIAPDGRKGVTMDGLTDAATGTKIAPGAQIFTGQVQAGGSGDLQKPVITDLQRGQVALGDFRATMDALRDVAGKDPSLFGTVGNVRRIGQGVAGQADAVSSLLGVQQFGKVSEELASAGVAPKFFDPNLTDVEKLASLAAFQAAKVLADQEGKGLSNQDFDRFREIVGDPASWLSTQQNFMAGLNRIDSLATSMAENRRKILQQGMAGVPIVPTPGSGAEAGAPKPVQRWGRDANGRPVPLGAQ